MAKANPVSLEGTPGANPVRGAEPFSGEELGKLRAAAGDDLLLFLVFRHTGLRVSDVATLRWDEIDWGAREIHKLTKKRKVPVTIPIAEELYEALAAVGETRPYIFAQFRKNTLRTTAQIAYSVRLMGSRANIIGVHPHRFRDSFAVDMLMRGATPFEVAQMLGDKMSTVEKHYLSFVSPMRDKVRDLMSNNKGLEAV
jgi:integrase